MLRCALLAATLLLWQAARAAVFTIGPAVSTNVVGTGFTLQLLQDGGTPAPGLQFQWAKDNTNLIDSDRIFGSQGSALTVMSCTLADSGSYRVTVSGNLSAASQPALVYVIDQPAITNIFLTPLGAGVVFTVQATGGLLSYQWHWQGQDIPGATNSTLRYTDAYLQANAGYYSVTVTNPLGSVTSATNPVLFTKTAPAGTYQGVYMADAEVPPAAAGQLAGSFQLTVSSSLRSYSGKMYSGSKVWPTSGDFQPDHTFILNARLPDGSTFPIQMQFITTNDAPQMRGTFVTDAGAGTARGYRVYYSLSNPTPLAGRYTLALVNTNPPVQVSPNVGEGLGAAPSGDGCVVILVQRNGVVAMAGRTADGLPFTQGWSLSRVGEVGMHVQVPVRGTQVLGIMNFARQAGGSISGGPIAWIKVPMPSDTFYPNGYNLALQALGSTYVPTNNPILSFTNGVASFYGGDLFDANLTPIWDFTRVYLRPQLKLLPEPSPEGLRLAINRLNGVITGSFIDPVTGLRAPVLGMVLQQQNSARGYFVSTNSAGGFTLMPGR